MRSKNPVAGWYHKDKEDSFITWWDGKKWSDKSLIITPEEAIIPTPNQLELPLETPFAIKDPEIGTTHELWKAFSIALLPISHKKDEKALKLKVFLALLTVAFVGFGLTTLSIQNNNSIFVPGKPSVETITMANALLGEVKYVAELNGRQEITYKDFDGMDMNLNSAGYNPIDSINAPWIFTGEDGTEVAITATGNIEVES